MPNHRQLVEAEQPHRLQFVHKMVVEAGQPHRKQVAYRLVVAEEQLLHRWVACQQACRLLWVLVAWPAW